MTLRTAVPTSDLWQTLRETYHYAVRLDNPPASLCERCTQAAWELLWRSKAALEVGQVIQMPIGRGRELAVQVVDHDDGRYVRIVEVQR